MENMIGQPGQDFNFYSSQGTFLNCRIAVPMFSYCPIEKHKRCHDDKTLQI